MDVSIIIPVYKRLQWIEKSLQGLSNQTYKSKFEVIIVDDGSPNQSEIKNTVKKAADKSNIEIHYIENKHAGPAAARNYGVRKANGSILCFLDDDSIPEPNWLEEIVQSFKQKSVDIVSGKILSLNREKSLSLLLEKAVYSGKCWATCNIAYRYDKFKILNGFDETFPYASWEDNDLGLRARWKGFRHTYNEKAVVYHPHESSLPEYKRKCKLNGTGAAEFSRKYIFRKPLWGFGTFFIMSKRLFYIISPSVWRKDSESTEYLKFLWSYYSVIGFFNRIMRRENEKN